MSLNLKLNESTILNCKDIVENRRDLEKKITFLEKKAVLLKKLIEESEYEIEGLRVTLEQVFEQRTSLVKVCDGINLLIDNLAEEFHWLVITVGDDE